MVLVQKQPFFQLFFLGNIGQENVFYDILSRENAFLSYKNKKFKESKNRLFSKGVNPGLCSKNGHFFNFYIQAIQPRKMFFTIFLKEETFLAYKKQKVQKVEKLTFFQGGKPMVLVQKWPLFQLFLLGNIGQENVFYDILDRKNAFLSYKDKKVKNSKN